MRNPNVPDNRIFIIAATHAVGQAFADRYGFPNGAYKTITRASSLLGMKPTSRILWVDSEFEHPDAPALQLELKKRFTNVVYYTRSGEPVST